MPRIGEVWGIIAPFTLGEVGKPVQIMRTGTWTFDDYGPLEITQDHLRDFVTNFKSNVRRQTLPITREHEHTAGAAGWIKDVYVDDAGNTLYAVPEYTEKGAAEVKDGAWKYTSAEFSPEWRDPETGTSYKNVLFGYTHTNFPRIKDMQAISCAEPRVVRLSEGENDLLTFSDDEWDAFSLADDHYTPQATRDALPTAAFAFVKQRKILIHRPGNVKAGIARFMQVQDVSDDERDTAWGRLKRAAKRFGITTPKSWRDLGHSDSTKESKMAEATNDGDADDGFDPKSDKHGKMTTKGHTHGKFGKHDHSADHSDAPAKGDANMSETVSLQLAEMRIQFNELKSAHERAVAELAETKRVLGIEKETRLLLEFTEGVEKAKREGKVTPAQADVYLSEGGKMGEEMRAFLLKDMSTRPKMIEFGEVGSGASKGETAVVPGKPRAQNLELAELAKNIKSANKDMSAAEALREAGRQMRERV